MTSAEIVCSHVLSLIGLVYGTQAARTCRLCVHCDGVQLTLPVLKLGYRNLYDIRYWSSVCVTYPQHQSTFRHCGSSRDLLRKC